jgi:hypothetical protein
MLSVQEPSFVGLARKAKDFTLILLGACISSVAAHVIASGLPVFAETLESGKADKENPAASRQPRA